MQKISKLERQLADARDLYEKERLKVEKAVKDKEAALVRVVATEHNDACRDVVIMVI